METKADYREIARAALIRAKVELDSPEDFRTRYAALELRMALEALIYERALLYSEELNNKKLNTWQPSKLLNLLLEVDPFADKSPIISFGRQDEVGVPPKEMTVLGKERVLSLSEIRKHYDRLGSYLHTPTIEQSKEGKLMLDANLRSKCKDVYKIIEEVVNSKIFNVTLKNTTSIDCIACGGKIIRRVNQLASDFEATCIECSATYNITKQGDDQFVWEPKAHTVKCKNPSCNHETIILDRDLKLNHQWKCEACKSYNLFVLGSIFSPNSYQKK